MTDKFRCGGILGEDVLQLREAAVHIHGDTLSQRVYLQCIQRQEKFVRVCGIHILAGVRESNPHAFRIGAACQLDPDAVVTFVGVQRRVAVQERIDQRGDLDEVPIAEGVPTFLTVSCPHFLRVKECTCLGGGALDLLHDEFAKSGIVSCTVEQVVVIQLIGNQHHIGSHLGVLDLHCPTEQEAFFYRHVFKSPFQPVMLGFGHLKAIQQIEEFRLLRVHCIISIPLRSDGCSWDWSSSLPSLRCTSPYGVSTALLAAMTSRP